VRRARGGAEGAGRRHEHFHCNFGHFTSFWDRLHGTDRRLKVRWPSFRAAAQPAVQPARGGTFRRPKARARL
jgi:sterol desaturase/sphingolipid hydroxylase (fatty acid hydroxylase superfamily)